MDERRYYDESTGEPADAAWRAAPSATLAARDRLAHELARLQRERDEARAELEQSRKDHMRVSDALHEKAKALIAAHDHVRDRDELLAVVGMGVAPVRSSRSKKWKFIGTTHSAFDPKDAFMAREYEATMVVLLLGKYDDHIAALSAARDVLRDAGLLGEVGR